MKDMLIYIAVIFFILISTIFGEFFIKNEKTKKIFILVPSLLCLLTICAFRGLNVGLDTQPYYNGYLSAGKLPWTSFNIAHFEPGYVLMTKIFSKAGIPFSAFLFVVYLFIFGVLGYFIYTNSKNAGLSMIIYIGLGYFTFNLTGIRNAVAIAFVLVAYEILKIKNLKIMIPLFFSTILIASSFHTAALAMSIMILLYKIRVKIAYLVVGVCFFFLAYIYREQLFMFITTYLYDVGEVKIYSFSGFLFLMLLICVSCAILAKFSKVSDWLNKLFIKIDAFLQRKFNLTTANISVDDKALKDIDFPIMLIYVGIVFSLIAGMTTFARITLYFYIFAIIAVPNVITSQKSIALRYTTNTMFTLFFIWFYYNTDLKTKKYNTLPYRFFWE